MNHRARICLVLLVIACAVTPACLFSRKAQARVPPPPLPAPTPSAAPADPAFTSKTEILKTEIPKAETPKAETSKTETPKAEMPAETPKTETPKTEAPSRRKAAARRRSTPVAPPKQPAPAPAQPEPAAPAQATPTTSPAQLGEILSPQQKAGLIRNLEQSLSAARLSLAKIAGQPLTHDQAETAKLASSLAAQAESARTTDLFVAAQLARRAELLARDLVNSIH